MSKFQLRSFIPSFDIIKQLLDSTASPEELELTLEVLKKWRSKGFSIPNEKKNLILLKTVKLHVPEVGLDILERRDLYGIGLESIREVDGLFHKLTVESRGEGIEGEEAKLLVDDCFRLLQLTQYVARESSDPNDPDFYGTILTLKFAVEKGESINSPRIHQLLVDLKEVGEDKLLASWDSLPKIQKSRVARGVRVLLESSTSEMEADLLKFVRILEGRVNEHQAGKGLRDAGLI